MKVKVAEAAAPLIEVFHSIGEEPLDHVSYFYVHGCLERIVFVFGSTSLVVLADEDDDTVVLSTASTATTDTSLETNMTHLPLWTPFTGKPFGWGYIVINQQGYCDGLLLSFGDMRSKILVQVLASSLQVSMISEAPSYLTNAADEQSK